MGFRLGDEGDNGLNEMNLIPLIDIMLVLMIIFLVTATVLNPSVPLDLPKVSSQVQQKPPALIQLSIDQSGDIFWDAQPVSLSQLKTKMNQSVADLEQGQTKPTVHLRADRKSQYDTLAKVLALASESGLTQIAFVSDASTRAGES